MAGQDAQLKKTDLLDGTSYIDRQGYRVEVAVDGMDGLNMLRDGRFDLVITEAPSYFVYHSLLETSGARVLTVPMDDGGMDVVALERLLERLARSWGAIEVYVEAEAERYAASSAAVLVMCTSSASSAGAMTTKLGRVAR